MEGVSLNFEVQDKFGKTALSFDEGKSYEEVKEQILNELNYLYSTPDNFVKSINVEVNERGSRRLRVFEKLNHREATEQITGLLKHIYRVEEKAEVSEVGGEAAPAAPISDAQKSWLSNYAIENMSQKDKVFLLLKHNHPGEWVRSQDLQQEYEIVFGEEIKLSSLSTYLARYFEEGALERRGSRAQREYKIPGAPPSTPAPAVGGV